MKILLNVLFLLMMALSFSVPMSACSDPNACSPDEPCICQVAGECTRFCTDEGCNMTCKNAGDCHFDCDDGKCNIEAAGEGNVNVTCKKGGCIITAKGQGTVSVSCEGGKCKMKCEGQGTCKFTNCPTNDCNCSASLTASCDE